jgi:hypothetical protein
LIVHRPARPIVRAWRFNEVVDLWQFFQALLLTLTVILVTAGVVSAGLVVMSRLEASLPRAQHH